MNNLLIVQTLVYGFSLWFGLYLLTRSGGKQGLVSAGLGLLVYGLGVGIASISRYAPSIAAFISSRYSLLALLPAIYWFGAAASLLPETYQIGPITRILIRPVSLTIIGLVLLLMSETLWLVQSLALILFLVMTVWMIWQAFQWPLPHATLKILLTASLFFVMSCVLLILPQEVVSNELVLIGMGGDLILLGYEIGKINAYDEGTALLPDMLASFSRTAIAAAAVGGQFFVLMAVHTPITPPIVILFYTTMATVICLATEPGILQKRLDQFLFGQTSRLAQERESLIGIAEALPRQDTSLDILALDDAEFARLTRRALSHYNDLSKLVSNPLIQLPIITTHLREKDKQDTSLERAHALRSLLEDHILQLRPSGSKVFDTADDWRFYNALYFPYVLDLKPYNVKPLPDSIDPTTQKALDWFQTYVPERTLYNWQTSAAKLIARQIRETAKPKPASK